MADSVQELYDELSQPFPVEYISWRVGATRQPYDSEIGKDGVQATDKLGKPLCYVDARAVMDRLDSICGPDGWQCNYTPGVVNSIVCNLGIRVGTEWLWKADGAGASDVEAEKGMLSDALKRAAVRWGCGRYLYDLEAPWVLLERGKFISKKTTEKLNDLHDQHAEKAGWGGPTAVAAYRFLVRVVQETVIQPSDVDAFREKHKGMFPLLRVAMRRHMERMLDNVGTISTKQAAE